MVKIVYRGKFDGDPDNLPHGEHKPGAVMFNEPEDPKKFGLVINIAGAVIFVVLAVFTTIVTGFDIYGNFLQLCIGVWLSLLAMIPHEYLHAICFKDKAYVYTNLKQGMLFVVGPEDMSRARFVFLSLLPNILFGFLPYIIYMFFWRNSAIGIFALCSISAGAGDYFNVFNALTQMPKGARTYMHKFNSFWYMP